MDLHALGWRDDLAHALDIPGAVPARVVGVHRGAADLLGADGPLRASGRQAADLAVGDWVGLDPPRRLARLTRRGVLTRQAVGRATAPQVLAANVDLALIVTSVGADFNPRRIERYLALALGAGIEATVVVHKIDLDPAGVGRYLGRVEGLAPDLPVIATTTAWLGGLDELRARLGPGRTVVLLGSSGVGKSSIVNALLGEQAVPTRPVRASDERGQHTTTARHLHVLDQGLLVDTPGIRELALWDDRGLDLAFAEIDELARGCAYRDCGHAREPDCAVELALERGELDPERLESWRRLCREVEARSILNDPERRRAAARRWGRLAREVAEDRRRRGR